MSDLAAMITAAPSTSKDADDWYPKPGKSTILFCLIESDTWQFTTWKEGRHQPVGLQIEEIAFEGGSAEIEQEQGMLDYAVYEQLDPTTITAGWWVMEGFYASYRRGDGWTTDDDVDYECDAIRRARWSDLDKLGIHPRSWLCKLLRIDNVVPADFWPYPVCN